MQIFGLHRNIYKLARYGRTQELLKEEGQRRLKLLGDWEILKRSKVPDAQIARVTGISRATYYRRKRALKTDGLAGVERRSTRPHRVRRSRICAQTQMLILKLRLENPTYGKAKIAILLRRDHGLVLSESSVGRVLKKLLTQGKISPYAVKNRQRNKRSFKGHAQRFLYGSKAKKPGELIQIDHMTVSKNGKRFKHFQAWDPLTKIILADITTNATSTAAAQFLNKVQDQLPFPVASIQVDGGSEFMKEFEASCAQKNIPLFVLPPKRPQWNGGVERGNRTFREDFYARKDVLGNTLAELQQELKHAVHKYNTFRPHQALKGMTPFQYTQSVLEIPLSQSESHML